MANILIVDDQQEVLEQLGILVESLGYQPLTTLYPNYLFDYLEHDSVDLILMDINMPDMNGLELLDKLKGHPDYKAIPIIMVTGDTDKGVLKQCIDKGATDFIVKPIDETRIRTRIQSALANQTFIKELEEKTDELEEALEIQQSLNDNLIQTTRELQQTQQQLIQAQKMEALGVLAGGIAHEFNNLLFAISGYSEMIREDAAENSIILDNVEQIIKAGKRAKDLVQQILTFSRRSETTYKPVEVGALIKEALKLMRSTLPTTIDIQQEISIDEHVVLADPTQIHQIIMNLCSNASHAMMTKGGILKITLERIKISPDFATWHEIQEGTYVKLGITDTGCGMDAEVADHIFEPFFTTKSPGQGTGMGLSVVHGSVKSHNGAITVQSKPEKGTTIEIFLPEIDSPVLPELSTSDSVLQGQESVLLVDDEQILVDMLEQKLTRIGYHVTATTNSQEALNYFQEKPNQFDLVITDQTMPNISGSQLAKQIISINPNIPIILITGYSETLSPEQAKSMGVRNYIIKPIDFSELGTLIRNILDEDTAVN
ncbi:MAG: response regulator [SAR324 cluster bacterium]|nr:response regulator [SAR324 cluster bacterium]